MKQQRKKYAVFIEGISKPYFVYATDAEAAKAQIANQELRVMWVFLVKGY